MGWGGVVSVVIGTGGLVCTDGVLILTLTYSQQEIN